MWAYAELTPQKLQMRLGACASKNSFLALRLAYARVVTSRPPGSGFTGRHLERFCESVIFPLIKQIKIKVQIDCFRQSIITSKNTSVD